MPYWSSHLDAAQSEAIVPTNHGAMNHPQAVAEIDRILRVQLGLEPMPSRDRRVTFAW